MKPIKGAAIEIPELDIVVETDETGKYELVNVKQGSWKVIVIAEGYEPKERIVTFKANETIEIDPFMLKALVGSGFGHVYEEELERE